MDDNISEPSADVRAFVDEHLALARALIARFYPDEAGAPFSVDLLDRTLAAWTAAEDSQPDFVPAEVVAIGVAFAEHLTQSTELEWVLTPHESGDMWGLLMRRGQGDVTVDPTAMVVRRWAFGATNFLESMRSVVEEVLFEAAASHAGLPTRRSADVGVWMSPVLHRGDRLSDYKARRVKHAVAWAVGLATLITIGTAVAARFGLMGEDVAISVVIFIGGIGFMMASAASVGLFVSWIKTKLLGPNPQF
jgi:hypothetical protein